MSHTPKQDTARNTRKTNADGLLQPERSFFTRTVQQGWVVALGALAVVGWVIFHDFLLFSKLLQYKDIGSDSLNGSYPVIRHAVEYFNAHHTFSWSFRMGMGQNITSDATGDVFNMLLLPGGPGKVAWLLGWLEFIRVVCAGLLFYGYLAALGRGFVASLTGALMFAFSGFIITGCGWDFSYEALLAAMMLWGFERLYLLKKPALLIISFLLLAATRPFDGVLYTIFLMVYAAYRVAQQEGNLKTYILLMLRAAGCGLLGAAAASPLLIEHIKSIIESPRVSGADTQFDKLLHAPVFETADGQQLGTAIHRFFASDVMGTGSNFTGWHNVLEGPCFYCGLPALLLAPLLLSFLPRPRALRYGGLLVFWLLPLVFPWFRHAFWLFSGDYYRIYSLVVAIIFIYGATLCLQYIIEGRKLNIYALGGITLGLLLIRALAYTSSKTVFNDGLYTAVIVFVLAYAFIIYWLWWAQKKRVPLTVFLALFCVELAWFSSQSVNRDTNVTAAEMEEKTGYNDYSIDAVKWIQNNNSGFYRIDKNYGSSPAIHSSLNDAMVQDYYGTSSYNSFNQKYYIQYLRTYQIISDTSENESRWCAGTISNHFLQNLNSVKFILFRNYKNNISEPIRQPLKTFGDITVLRNTLALPFGYTYSNCISLSDFKKLRNYRQDLISLRAAVVNDEDLPAVAALHRYGIRDTIDDKFNFEVYKRQRDSLAADTLTIDKWSETDIEGHINLKTPKMVYLSIPFDKGWHIYADEKETAPVLIANGMMGVAPGTGTHKIRLKYTPVYSGIATGASVAGLLLIGFIGWRGRRKNGRPDTNTGINDAA